MTIKDEFSSEMVILIIISENKRRLEYHQKRIQFLDTQFKGIELVKINRSDVIVETSLDKYLKIVGDHCETVIDIGCGMGTSLMTSLCLGEKIKKGFGLDTSTHAIDFANQTSKLSDFHELSYIIGDETYLDSLADHSFDGIICSNFLDVIPKALSDKVIESIIRLLKPNGFVLTTQSRSLLPLQVAG